MLIQKAYKFRLEPDEEQAQKMAQFAGCARYVWNRGLALQKETLEQTGKIKTYAEMCSELTTWKQEDECYWLKDAPIHALQQSLKNLDTAFQRFFDKDINAAFPRFKKKGQHASFKESDRNCFHLNGAQIKLSKLESVDLRLSREVEGTPKNVTVSRKSQHWFVSIQVELKVKDPQHPSTSEIGIDLGIAQFAAFSDGTALDPINSFKKQEKKLAKEQRNLSRKTKFSNNWKKQKAKVQQVHSTISDIRQDFLHKASTQISKNHAILVMEDLKVSNMSKSAQGTKDNPGTNVAAKSGLNKSIIDQGWYEFRRQLTYKQQWRGGQVILVPPQYTSQECSQCHHTDAGNRPSQALFCCLKCGHTENADVNAAKNILAVGHTVIACGDIRPAAV